MMTSKDYKDFMDEQLNKISKVCMQLYEPSGFEDTISAVLEVVWIKAYQEGKNEDR